MRRFSIANLLAFVVAFALGLAAVINANEFWVRATLLLTLVALLGSVLGTILRGWRGGGWPGFAVFGWGYFLLLLAPGLGDPMRSLSDPLVDWTFQKANPSDMPEVPVPVSPTGRSPFEKLSPSTPPAPVPPEVNGGPVALNMTPADPFYRYYSGYLPGQSERSDKARVIGQWLATLAFAGLGAVMGIFLSRRPSGARAAPLAPADPPTPR